MPRLHEILLGCAVALITHAANAADKSDRCKNDPRVVDQCEWLKGIVGISADGVTNLDMGPERSFVIADDIATSLDWLALWQAGEYEFCRFKDRTIDVMIDYDGTTAPLKQAWGCINTARNVIQRPDNKTMCAYAPHRITCEAAKN